MDHEIKVEYEGSFDTDPGEYPWDASGSITLVPWRWQWWWGGMLPGGEWVAAETVSVSVE